MGGLDINLIKEYAKCPGLYDRNSAYYKDRMYIQEKWSEISQKLGFEVRLLKERMLQLRNRYNLEKRRIDTLRAKYPSRVVRSQWPLYKHMDFMNGHIKHRRSFSKMTPRPFRPMSVEGDIQSQSPLPMTKIHNSAATSSSGISTQKSFHNGEVDIKFENTFDFDEDPPSVMNVDNDNFMDDDSELKDSTKYVLRPQVTLDPPELLNDEPCLYEKVPLQQQQQQQQQQQHHQLPPFIDAKEKLRMARLKKYETFGKFLAMSLCDMSEIRAMKIIEKITSDLVVSYLNVDNADASPATTIISTTSTSVISQQQQPQQQQQQQQQQNQIIQTIDTIPKQTQQAHPEQMIKKIEEKENLGGTETSEEQVLHTTTNATLNTLVDGEEYEDQEDEDQFVFDLTEDEPLST